VAHGNGVDIQQSCLPKEQGSVVIKDMVVFIAPTVKHKIPIGT